MHIVYRDGKYSSVALPPIILVADLALYFQALYITFINLVCDIMLYLLKRELTVNMLHYLGLSLMNVVAIRIFPVCLYFSTYELYLSFVTIEKRSTPRANSLCTYNY